MDRDQATQAFAPTNHRYGTAASSNNINYRVRRLPTEYNLEQAKSLLRTTLGLDDTWTLRVGSIAPDLEDTDYQVATISFNGLSKLLPAQDDRGRPLDQWTLFYGTSDRVHTSDESEKTITIDTHFRDFTPLNVPQADKNVVDLIAVCGLNGHAFGSFKQRDGAYMWLRDGVPRERTLENVRVITYGYDSRMIGSRSFQGLEDIASAFKNRLKGVRRHLTSIGRPIVLLGHSLGGLVVKEALIQMAESTADGNTGDAEMLHAVYALVFFGVPSRGMEVRSFMAMVHGQPNEPFVSMLDKNSGALTKQHRQFCQAFPFEDSVVFSFFETEKSPTAVKVGEQWEMSGPLEVLVDITSATQSRTLRESKPHFLQAINRSHSELVKFSPDDEWYNLVRGKIEEIAESAVETIRKRFLSSSTPGVIVMEDSQIATTALSTSADLSNQRTPSGIANLGVRNDSLHMQRRRAAIIRTVNNFHDASLGHIGTLSTPSNPLELFSVEAREPNPSTNLEVAPNHVIGAQHEEERSLREAFLSTLESDGSNLLTKQSPARHTDACEWFFTTSEYSNWMTQPQPQTLIITAPTGRGKSVLAEYVVSKLQYQSEDHTILSYFCKDGQNTRQKAMAIVRSLLYNLLSRRRELLRYVPQRALVMEGEKALTFQNLWEILMHVLRASGREGIVCIIDGLDECDEDSRKLLQEAIERDLLLADPSAKPVRARFLITSQPIKSVLVLAQRSIYLSIRPEHVNKDIIEYVYAGIKTLKQIGPHARMAQELADEIEEAIKKRADGSFQWAKLVLRELEEVPISRNNIIQVFEQVPKDLKRVYETCFERIGVQELPRARKILTVLLFASRALTPEELGICMLTDPAQYHTHSQVENNYDHSMEWEANVTCGSFLDVSDKLINITHQSARESLLSFSAAHTFTNDFVPFNAEEGHRLLAISCLSYLLLDDFQGRPKEADDRITNASFPFLRYAEANWAVHLRNVNVLDGLESILQRFFTRSIFRPGPWKTVWPRMSEYFPVWEGYEDIALFHLFVHAGLLSVLQRCALVLPAASHGSNPPRQSSSLPEDHVTNSRTTFATSIASPILTLVTGVEDEDALGNTALMRAMKSFEWSVTLWLIVERDADPNTVDDQGTTLAHLVAQSDSGIFIKFLQRRKVNVNRADGYGSTPLQYALELGCEDAAAILLRICPTRDSRSGLTSLHLVASSGRENLVQLALDCGSGVNQATKNKITALMLASRNGHLSVVKKLLEKGADADLKDYLGLTALHCAARAGKDRIVEVLLKYDVLPNDVDDRLCTPLHYAAWGGFEDIVRRLLPHVADLDACDDNGDSALHLAVLGGHLNIVEELVREGVNINQASNNGYTPFHLAVDLDHRHIAQFLATQEGALLDTVSTENRTPLITAASSGQEGIVQLLLRHGVNVEGQPASHASSNDTFTPLQYAADGGFLGIVKDLVNAKASINKSNKTWTPLLCAAHSNHPDVVGFFLDQGADPRCATTDNWNLLHYAARDGHEVLVSRLLRCGLDVSSPNKTGQTPVYYACQNGSVQILVKLLAEGGDIELASNSGLTALLVAIDRGNRDIVQHLLQMKVDVNQASGNGLTPLVLAAGKENYATLKLLLENGASCRELPPRKWSPLHEAARKGRVKNVALLLQSGHPVDIPDAEDTTPLLCAAAGGHVLVVKTLLRYHANIKAVSKNGLSFLLGAVHSRSAVLFRIGIDKGAEINGSGPEYTSPILVAIDNNDWEFFHELLSRRAQCPRETIFKRTVLHQAAQPGFWRIVQELLKEGFDPNARDIYGFTPLHMAGTNYHKTTVRILVEYGADLAAIDCFGRTAQYWARRRFNHGLGNGRRSLAACELDSSHRRQRLEQTIRFCIERLLQYPSLTHYYYVLGKCLQFEGDTNDARIAFEQRMDQAQRPKMIHQPYCNVCGPHESIKGYRYVCNSCADIDLCSQCFNGSWKPASLGRGCHAHSFLQVPGPDWETRPAGVVDAKGSTVEEWLRGLRPAKSSGLQDPRNGAWSRVEQQMQSQLGFWDLIDVLYEFSDRPKNGTVDDMASASSANSDISDTDEDMIHFVTNEGNNLS